MMSACLMFYVCCVLGGAKDGLRSDQCCGVLSQEGCGYTREASVQLFCELYTAHVGTSREHEET